MLWDRDYKEGMIDAAISRARSIPRAEAIKKVIRDNTQSNKRPVFVVSWDPRLPSIPAITQKHWRSMATQDPYLEEVFPQPPLTAYKRQKNISDYIIRAKVPPNNIIRPRRMLFGMRKCNKPYCPACPYIEECKSVKANHFNWNISDNVNCESYNIVYIIHCTKENCQQKYIGESYRKLKDRLLEHQGYINNRKLKTATGFHFNQPGHSISNLKISILEKVKSVDLLYRKEREKYLIHKFNTFYKGINQMP